MEIFTVEEEPPQHKMLIHFHDADLRLGFVTDLIKECKSNNINVSITVDDYGGRSLPLDVVLQKIEESKIVLVIFSEKYTDSIKCSRELDKIKDCWDKGTLMVFPIYYWLKKSTVRSYQFSDAVSFTVDERSIESYQIDLIVNLVKENLNKISREGSQVRPSGDVKFADLEQFFKTLIDVVPYKKCSTYEERSKDLNDMEKMLPADTGNCSSESKKIEEIVERIPWEGSRVDPSGLSEAAAFSQFVEEKYGTYEERSTRVIGLFKDSNDMDGIVWKVKENVKKILFGIKEIVEFILCVINAILDIIPWDGIQDCLKICFLLLPLLYLKFDIEVGPSNFYERIEKVEDKDTNFCNSYEITEKVEDKDTNFCNSTCTNSSIYGKVKPPNIQVFINFRGDQLRRNFISYLVDALQRSEVNVFIDKKERKGEDLNKLFKRIEGSGIAIVVFSSRYAESHWCLDELVKIRERALEGLLKVLPIYYKVNISNVKRLKGDFGDHFRDKELMYQSDQAKIKRWKEAISFVTQKFALSFDETSTELENEFVRTVVEEVLEILQDSSTVKSGQSFGSEL